MKLFIISLLVILVLTSAALIYFNTTDKVTTLSAPSGIVSVPEKETSPSPAPSPAPTPSPLPVFSSQQGIYGTTYEVSGQEPAGGGPSKYPASVNILVFTVQNRPVLGTNPAPSARASATISSDTEGKYRLSLPIGEYCAWNETIRNCFSQEIKISAGVWQKIDFTVFGQ